MNLKQLRLLLTVALLAQSLSAAGNHTLIKDWETFLGPHDGKTGHVFRVAVCHDGSAYLSDSLGRLIRVNSGGAKANDQSGLDSIRWTVALACNENGEAVAGMVSSSSIVVLSPQADGTFSTASFVKVTPATPIFDIVSLPGTQGYVVVGVGVVRKEPLHLVSQAGQVIADPSR